MKCQSTFMNLKYIKNGVTVLWFGDLENTFMEKIKDEIELPKADIIFAPHHGRSSGKILSKWLTSIKPKMILIGEAPSKKLIICQDIILLLRIQQIILYLIVAQGL